MNDKGHFYISLIKSIIRIATCVAILYITNIVEIKVLAIGFGVAEILGVAEEVFDRRA